QVSVAHNWYTRHNLRCCKQLELLGSPELGASPLGDANEINILARNSSIGSSTYGKSTAKFARKSGREGALTTALAVRLASRGPLLRDPLGVALGEIRTLFSGWRAPHLERRLRASPIVPTWGGLVGQWRGHARRIAGWRPPGGRQSNGGLAGDECSLPA